MVLINPYIAPFKPVNNITPFTYRDGLTYLEILESLTLYVQKTLVTYVNETFTGLGDNFEIEVNKLITDVNLALTAQTVSVDEKIDILETFVNTTVSTINTALADQTTYVDTEIANLTAYVNAEIAAIIAGSFSVTEAAISQVINDEESSVRTDLDSFYADKSIETIVTSGRLTEASLDADYADKSIETIVTSGRLTETSLDADYADKSIETIVTSGRLTEASLDADYANKSIETIVTSGRLTEASLDADYSPLSLTGTYASRPAANTVPNGTIYYCSNIPEMYRSNGTIWTVVGSGGNELAVGQTTLDTTTSTSTDIAGLSISFIVGERPIEVRFDGTLQPSTTTNLASMAIFVDGVERGAVAKSGGGFGTSQHMTRTVRVSGLTAGSTIVAFCRLTVVNGGTATLDAAVSTPAMITAKTI